MKLFEVIDTKFGQRHLVEAETKAAVRKDQSGRLHLSYSRYQVHEAEHVTCEWFALCDRTATRLIEHPVLGRVPTCERCAERSTA